MQIGPNPLLMGRHYPLDVAAQCDVRGTLRELTEAVTRLHGAERAAGWARQRAKVRAFAALLIEREENLVREHENDADVHPSVLEAQLAQILPKETRHGAGELDGAHGADVARPRGHGVDA